MKIALVAPNLAGGGAERVTLTLAEEFASRGISVDIVLMRNEGDLLGQVSNAVRVVDLQTPRIRQVPFAFGRYLRQVRPDAVIANIWPLTTACIAARAITLSKTRLVVCDHQVVSNAYLEKGHWHEVLLRRSISALYPLADARVTVSAGVANDLSAFTGMPRSCFDVIFNPIIVKPPVAGAATAVDAVWQGWQGKRIISVGTLKKVKNQALLIHAFAQLVEGLDARLMILGEGSLRGELVTLAHQLKIAHKLILPGFFADPAPFYRSADLFVLSSDSEGFGNVIIEAMACGLPVVSTDCPFGPAELLESGRYGRLVPVADGDALATAMAAALAAVPDRETLKRRAAEFSPDRAADQYLALLFPPK